MGQTVQFLIINPRQLICAKNRLIQSWGSDNFDPICLLNFGLAIRKHSDQVGHLQTYYLSLSCVLSG